MSELKCSFCDFNAQWVGAGEFFCNYHALVYHFTHNLPLEK